MKERWMRWRGTKRCKHIAPMGLQTSLLIVLAGTFATTGLAQPITTAKSAFSPQSGDELKSAVDTCLNGVQNVTINDSDTDIAKGFFTFVLIPAGNESLKEVQKRKTSGPEKDNVKKYAKGYFGYSYDTDDGKLDRTELDYPRPANNFTYVTMFSCMNAKANKLPVNRRASQVATACMTFNILIYGDAFLARYHDKVNPDNGVSHWSSYNMLKSEVDKEAAWVVQAAKFNAIVKENLVRDDIETNPNSEFNAKGNQGPVSWSQNEDDIEIIVDLPKGTKGRDINVVMKHNLIKFGLKNGNHVIRIGLKDEDGESKDMTLLQRLLAGLEPAEMIDPELSTWSLAEGQLVMTLTKRKPQFWQKLFKK